MGRTAGDERARRLEVFEANYGRDFGWFVEKDGRRIAVLTDPRFEDMFWYSYLVEPFAEAGVFNQNFWDQPDLVFRNRLTGEVAPNACPGAAPTSESPRVWMRALYTSMRPTALERVLLWLRRKRG